LRALSYTGVKQFAEAGFGVLNWPCGKAHEDLQLTIYLTSLIEKLFFIYAEKPIQIGAFQTLNNIKKLYMELFFLFMDVFYFVSLLSGI